MTTLEDRISRLSPQKRRLLEARLRREGIGRSRSRSVPPRETGDGVTFPLGPFPLTWGMQRLWFVERLAPGTTAYNIPFAGRLRGGIDPGVLAAAFREVVRRHEVLRTRFPARDGRPVQVVEAPPASFSLPLVDLTALPPALREREAVRLTDAHPQQHFDLGSGPMLRVDLVRLEPDLHDLLVTMPHIVTDAWSMAVLFRELPPIYEALRRGEPSPLPELPIQVADYARWQRDWLSGRRLEEEMDFWRRHLDGASVVLELPTDRPRPPVQDLRGRRHYLDLTPAEARAVRALADREGVTVFMVLLAVFHMVLLRWTGQRDQLVGTPIATRSQPESHGLIGFFIDNAVLRLDLAGEPTFSQLLQRVKTSSLTTFDHGDLPFDRVVEAAGVERDLSRPPLIQHVFVHQNVHIPEPEFDGLELLRSQQTDARSARFELTLGWFDWHGGLRGGFEYAVALFDRTTMARMAGHYRNLLLAGLEAPQRRISELPMLGAGERQQVRVEHPREPRRVPGGAPAPGTVDGRVRTAAAAHPDAVAVADGDAATLTYAELVERGGRLAARLRARGVAPEEPVGVLSERAPELAVALYGVLAAGACYLPLDPALPAARRDFLLADSGARFVVRGRLDAEPAPLPVGVEPVDPAELPPAPAPAPSHGPDHLAYLLYTSGTTGEPKGSSIAHRAAVHTTGACGRAYGLTPADRVAQVAAVGFDASLLEMLPALAAGARLESFHRDTVLAGPAFVAALAQRRVSVLITVPSLLAGMPPSAPAELPALRLLVVGGETLPPALARRWGEGRRLVNSYGPTETAVVACEGEREAGEAAPPIGRPLPGVEALVLDPAAAGTPGRAAPFPVAGELCLAGPGLGRGYHRRPAATAAVFVPHPWSSRPGARLYRTGDRVRRRRDGRLEFLGRLDGQVKVRGQRVELGEVEAALVALPGVAEAAAAVRADAGRPRLVAYLVPAAGADAAALDDGILRAALARRLTDAMVPADLVRVETLPRLASGKLDRDALPAPPRRHGSGGAPRTEVEERLAAVWRELLGVEEVGPEDDFFALGGDSIASIQMISRAAVAGVHLTPQQVFGHPTLGELATVATAEGPSPAAQTRPPEVGPAPLLPVQSWFLDLGLSHPDHWNMSTLLALREPVAPGVLAAALAAVVERHGALRLRLEDGRQSLAPPPETVPPLPVVDHSALPVRRAATARRAAAGRHQGALDLGRGPVAPLLFRGAEDDHLLLTVHHLAVDAVSLRVLLEDLERACRRLAAGTAPSLPPPPTSYRVWGERLERWAAGPEAAEERRRCAAGLPEGDVGFALFAADDDGAGAEGAAGTVELRLDGHATAALLHAATALGAGVEGLLLTALAEAAAPLTGRRALAVDVEGHGRETPFADVDLSRTVGWLTSIEPLLLDLRHTDPETPAASLAAVRAAVRSAAARPLPWSALRWLPGGDDLALPPRPVSFNYLGRVDSLLAAAGLFAPEPEPPRPLRHPAGRRPHSLELNAWIADGALATRWRHPPGRGALVAALAERFRAALAALAAVAEGGAAETAGRDLPLSFAQERLWFLDRLEPGNPAYNISAPVRLEGRLDRPALARALGRTVCRHEALRTTFPTAAGGPVQRVGPPFPVALPAVDLSALPAPLRSAEERRLLRRHAARPFDLARGPLLRALLLDLGEGEDGPLHDLHLGLHHIVADGWSMSVLVRETAALYAAFAGGEEPDLPPPALQYGDHAAGQRRRLANGDAADGELAYWRRRLEGLPPALELPVDRPRPPRVTYRGGEVGRTLSPELSAGLRALGRDASATPFMVLLALLQVLLARLSGQRDFAVGSPIAGRGAGETQGTIGLFLNHLALRSELPAAGDLPFVELLSRVRAGALAAFRHAEVPFERVIEEVAPQRDLSRTPLFQIFLNMLNFPSTEAELPGLRLSELPPAEPRAMFEWTLYVKERGTGGEGTAFHLELLYNADLYDAATAREALAQLETLARGVVADPRAPVLALPLLTPEARRVLPERNARLDASWPGPVHAAVAAHAAASPDHPAVVEEGRSVSYGALAQAAARLTGTLRRAGVGPGDRVAIRARRGAELVAAVLAVHRAGASFLLLDPAHPAVRNAATAARAAPRALLTLPGGGATPPEVAAAASGAVRLDLAPLEEWEGDPAPAAEVTADHPAVVTFTSGSTGAPKGVVGLHRSLTHFLPWQAEHFRLAAGDRFSLLSGLAHDPLQREMFTALWLGATLAVPDAGRLRRPGALARWMAETAVTVAHLTPAMARLLCELPPVERGGAETCLPDLRRVFFLGDALTRGTVARLAALAPAVSAVNLYGATETQRAVAWQPVETEPVEAGAASRVVPLGRGMPDVQLLVLRPDGGACGLGEVGEVVVRSPHLAAGYLADPALSAARFLPDAAGGRLYRTGDLGRYRRDGAVVPLGRADRQVKVRGFRLEPAEVEAALETHPAVAEAAVGVWGDGEERRLVAWWVPREAMAREAADDDGLRRHLGRRLPEPMVPTAFVRLDALPLTPNRKLDRTALPAPNPGERRGEPPATPTEELLAAAWRDVLGVGRVHREDDFFALGGHSLKLIQVLSRLAGTFGVELPVRALFQASTLAAMAAAVETARRGGGAAQTDPLPPLETLPRDGGVPAPVPASYTQQRLLFLERMQPGSPAYHVPAALDLAGELDVGALRRALVALVRRHEALRTAFADLGGTPMQVVAPPSRAVALRLPRVDLAALPPARRGAEAERLLRAEARAPFDLRRAPLLRCRLLRLGRRRHRLLFLLHHLVTDGWSLGLLLGDSARLYAAGAAGETAEPPPAVQYADFTVWQRGWLRGAELERQLGFWRRRLEGVGPLLLPTDRPRPALPRGRGARLPVVLPAAQRRRAETLAAERGATLFMVLCTAWQAVLARWSGQSDFAVGIPVANRRHPALEKVVGFFANTLALPAAVGGDPGFASALARVREEVLDAFAHQDLPFEKLVRDLAPRRDRSRPPLFQVMLTLENAPRETFHAPGLELTPASLDPGTARFDLVLGLGEADGGGLAGVVEYDADLFDRTTVARLWGHLRTLLAAAAAGPERRLSALPLLTAAERQQVGVEWRGGRWRGEEGEPPHLRFLRRAAARPQAPAVSDGAVTRSYGELAARAAGWAAALRQRGVAAGELVAVALPPGADLVAALLGVHLAGAAYLPLDPRWPERRQAAVVADAACRLLIGGASPPAAAVEVLRPEETGDGEPAPAPVTPDHPAYVIYTSGSTGVPKGVPVSHRNVARLLEVTAGFGFGPDDAWTLFHSAAFDFSVWELWGALAHGGRLVIVPTDTARDPAAFLDLLRREAVTVLNQTPSAFAQLDREDAARGGAGLPTLRWVIFGGEALDPASLAGWFRRRGDRRPRLVNMYGITETTVHVTLRHLTAADAAAVHAASPIGRPLPDLAVHVVDRRGHPVPVGVPGELWVAGPGVARGYLGRPSLTAGRFVPDPFAAPEEAGRRVYRSGDRVRWTRRGELEYLGRLDRQVQVRGHRVEPGEVETALRALPAVAATAVVVRDDLPAGPGLVAWVVPAAGGEPAEDALRAALRERLPDYMLPARFLPLDGLPQTANRKVDRGALAALPLPAERPLLAVDHAPPAGPTEELLAQLWSEVLGVERVGRHDDFFDLGGHSLAALRLAASVGEELGVELPLAELFEQPTLAAVARATERSAARGETGAVPPPLVPLPAQRRAAGDLPASYAQERLWFLDRLRPGGSAYNVPVAADLEGPLDATALHRGLAAVVGRHEVLRTALPERAGRPVQEVLPPERASVPLPRVDLADLPAFRRAPEADRLARRFARLPFDLATAPLLRAALLRLDDRRHRFLLVLHHAVCDEWSMAVLLRELGALYPALERGGAAELPALPVQYADYAAWQRGWLSGTVLERELDWWRVALKGAGGRLGLPLDRPRSAADRADRGGRVPLELPAPAAVAVSGATPFHVTLAALCALLARYGNRRPVVGVPVANRGPQATESMIGFFVNTLPLGAEVDPDAPFAALVREVRARTLAAFAHAEVPFERIVAARQRDGAPLAVDVMLAFHNVPLPRIDLPGLSFAARPVDNGAAKLDLLFQVGEERGGVGGLTGTLEYRSALFDRATAARIAGHLGRLLAAVADDPQRPVAALPLLSDGEREQLLLELRGGHGAAPPRDTALHRFARHAAVDPAAPAVTDGGRTWSYRELAARAARLATDLRRRGVVPEEPVAVLMEPSAELVAALLGVLFAGAAYLPLDPRWPAARRAAVLADAGCRRLVSDRQAPRGAAVETVAPVAAGGDATLPPPPVGPEHLAYVIYTSGSTGAPKGVPVSHGNVARLLNAAAGFGFRADDVWTLFHSAAFDFSVWELWGALAHGGRLVVVPPAVARDPDAFLDLLRGEAVTVLNQTPSAFVQLDRADAARGGVGLPALRWLVFGGEALDPASLTGWFRRRGDRRPRLVNMYGITETTVHVTFRPLGAADAAERRVGSPIGVPIPDLAVYVVDRRGRPVPVGVPGELQVGGPGLARGYLGRPALTADRFVPDPFATPEEAGRRLYRSGDRGRWTARGELEALGRLDDQVQIRGHRVEPGEVEAALAALPGVTAAAVVARHDLPGGTGLVAWVVPAAGEELAEDETRAALRRRLPDYMLPARLLALDALPLTANRKVDRRALGERPLPGDRPRLERGYEPPAGAVEEVLAGAWAEALEVERVGRHDGFFDLGGHSLLATRMVSWVRDTFGVEVPLAEVFAAPTVAALAAWLTADPERRERVERSAELLLEMAGLSDDEVARELSGAGGA